MKVHFCRRRKRSGCQNVNLSLPLSLFRSLSLFLSRSLSFSLSFPLLSLSVSLNFCLISQDCHVSLGNINSAWRQVASLSLSVSLSLSLSLNFCIHGFWQARSRRRKSCNVRRISQFYSSARERPIAQFFGVKTERLIMMAKSALRRRGSSKKKFRETWD
jgi:hypothetical protein